MKMETIEDMDKILEILNAEVAKRKIPYNARPDRTMAECYALAENHEEYIALLERERKVINAYFNGVQMQEWAQNHKRWIETGLNGYTVRELSPVGKETLANFVNNLEVSCEETV
jgi:hypothetical protein